ncbi:MAG: valine--tRNA ligase, partial [Proteobacteria bacterium]|nr:valine--tRNA ligase [Pseudomonadota bacterium]
LLLQDGNQSDRTQAGNTEEMLKRLAKVTSVGGLESGTEPPPNALALVGELKVMVPLAGLIDVEAERARLGKEVTRCETDLKKITGKLSNEAFISKAPADVVDKERQRAKDLETTLATLAEQLQQLQQLQQLAQLS